MKNIAKYIGIVILIIMVAFLILHRENTYYNNVNLQGDVNGDNKVSIDDYLLIRKHLLKSPALTGQKLVRADVDGKNGVTTADYILLRKIILGLVIPVTPKPTTTVTPTKTPTPVPTKSPTPTPSPSPTPTPTPTPSYVITTDSKYASYKTIKEYNSSTLKYRIISYNSQDIVLIWAANPLMQMNGALASSDALHSASADTILANEISKYSYQNKGMIAINASFYAPVNSTTGSPSSGVVINHGTVVKNTGLSAGVIGINSRGILSEYVNASAGTISGDGVRNTFVESSRASIDPSQATANRTQICQYDTNNFVILSGSGTVYGCGKDIENLTGCTNTFNLDGGGSRKLYYKDASSSTMTKHFGGGRLVADMLYFIE